MLNEIFQCLQKLSSLHVVPYYPWTPDAIRSLEILLEGVPYCLTPHGNVFLGENQIENIQLERVCLQAHLDHPGGVLNADQQTQYLFTQYYGTNARLLGYPVGIYEPGISEKIAQLEVENAIFQGSGQATCLFFKPNQTLYKALSKKTLLVHQNALPDMTAETISNWNTGALIHCALIIALLRSEEFSGRLYGLLSLNAQATQNGIRGFVYDTVDNPLFLINLDSIDNTLQLKNLDDAPYQQSYGIRAEQAGIKLDQFIFPELLREIERAHLAKIPAGHCEAHAMQAANRPFISLFLKIRHYHNGVTQKKFTAEYLAVKELSHYVNFAKDAITMVKEHVTSNHSKVFLTTVAGSQPEPSGTIHLVDQVEAIKNIFDRCQSFPEYLQSGIPKLQAIYSRYHIRVPNISADNFARVKNGALNGKFPEIQASQVYVWKNKVLGELTRLFNHNVLIQDKPVTLVTLLLANFNAFHVPRLQSIFLSLEHISEDHLERLLIHELTHHLMADAWDAQNISSPRREYYDEGLAVAISRKLSNSTLAEALYMKEEDFAAYLDNRAQLRMWFEEHATGKICSYFDGKYHQYFQRKPIIDPFMANGHQYQRYGYVLAALETEELMEKEMYYEYVFRQPVS